MDRLTNRQRDLAARWVRWAYKLANRRAKIDGRLDAGDLAGAALMALCRAARGHNPKGFAAFSNYARAAIVRALDAECCRQAADGLAGLGRAMYDGRVKRERARATCELTEETAGWWSAERLDGDDRLWAEVDALPARARRAVLLHFAGGMTFADVGRAMRVTPAAAKHGVARGLAMLRERLGEVA